MSFLSTIANVGRSALNFVTGNSLGSNILKTVVAGYALNRVTSNVSKSSSDSSRNITPRPDPGVRLQIPGNQDRKVPVVYGNAQLGGIITDAVMDSNNTRMTYVITLSEKTGKLLSDGTQSETTYIDAYYNDQRIIFQSDGITAAESVDRDGNRDKSINGLVEVYFYDGNSDSGKLQEIYSGTVPPAYDVVPNWTSNHRMSELIFAVVRVKYDRDKGVTRLPRMRFHIENSMTLAGDCLLDYMTNERYGAGIQIEDIFDE